VTRLSLVYLLSACARPAFAPLGVNVVSDHSDDSPTAQLAIALGPLRAQGDTVEIVVDSGSLAVPGETAEGVVPQGLLRRCFLTPPRRSA